MATRNDKRNTRRRPRGGLRLPKGPKMNMKSLLGLTLAGLAYQNRGAIGAGLGKGFNWLKGLFGGGEGAMPIQPGSYDPTNPMNIDMQDSYDPLNPQNFTQEEYMENLGSSYDPANPFNDPLPPGMGWNNSDIGFDDMSFNDAFAANRKAGAAQFDWRGNPYTTETAEDLMGAAETQYEQGMGPQIGGPIGESLTEEEWNAGLAGHGTSDKTLNQLLEDEELVNELDRLVQPYTSSVPTAKQNYGGGGLGGRNM